MRGIELFIIFSMTAFHLPVMSRRKRTNLFMPDSELFQRFFKERRLLFLAVSQLICELESIIRLNAFNGVREFLYNVLKKHSRGICVLFFKRLQIPETAVFIDKGVLIVEAAALLGVLYCLSRKTCRRNIFHINLHLLPRILHLFVRFWDIFRVWQLDGIAADSAQQLIQSGDGSVVATLA